jgi:flagellar hook-associated protein 2
MAIDSDYVKQMATQLAAFEVQSAQTKAQRNQATYKAQLAAVTSLDTALKSFKSTVAGLKSVDSSMLVNSATFSKEGYASADVSAKAVPGSYQFFVEQLASSHQVSLEGFQDGEIPNSGTLTIGQGGSSFNIDLSAIDSNGDGSNSLQELANAINAAAGNTGVKSTLVRSNGQVSLILASEKSGAANAISLSSTGVAAGTFASALVAPRELSTAKDAQVRLGGESGMLLTNASNTFENVIDGISLTFNQIHVSGEQPLTMTVGQDQSATKDKVQSFITAFNSLMSTFDSLTASGGEDSTRGSLAGDAGIRAIESMLNQTLRKSFGGRSLMEFGIVADRSGKLTIDAKRFEKAVAADPDTFDKLFSDKGNLLDSIDKNLAVYTSSANGVLKNRKDSLDLMLKRVDDQFDTLQKQYDLYYSRYLKQYTSLMQTQSAMEQTNGMF